MVKTDLLCTNSKCRHYDQGVCVIRVPYYPGEEVDYCIFYDDNWTEGDLVLANGRWYLDTGHSHIEINENHIVQILAANGV